MIDQFGRVIDYMRISVTDRCNLRCRYCMPFGIQPVEMEEILSYEEIIEVSRYAVFLGICNFKITGGEPLVRKGVADLIGALKALPGVKQVTLTTNGLLLEKEWSRLRQAGLDAVNISLDSLDAAQFKWITGFRCLHQVQKAIHQVLTDGVALKINAVLLDWNREPSWRSLVELARDAPIDVRFIEMMPIGYGKQFQTLDSQVVMEDIVKRYGEPILDETRHGNGPALYYRLPGFRGSIGFISAVNQQFCDSCNRIRLTAQGFLKPCLCYDAGVDLKTKLRQGDLEGLHRCMRQMIEQKPKAHCFHDPESITESASMVRIGG